MKVQAGVILLACLLLLSGAAWWGEDDDDHHDTCNCKLDQLKDVRIKDPEDGQCLIFHKKRHDREEEPLALNEDVQDHHRKGGKWRNEDCPAANCTCNVTLNQTIVRVNSGPSTPLAINIQTASCPTGTILSGGGCLIRPAIQAGSTQPNTLVVSSPSLVNDDEWTCAYFVPIGTNNIITASAICLSVLS